MNKKALTDEARDLIESELLEMSLIERYLSKSGQQRNEFESIESRNEFVLLDGAVRVPKILMFRNANGVTEIVNRVSKEFEIDFIDGLSKKNGLSTDEVISLMGKEMHIEILENGNVRQEFLERIAKVDENGLMVFDEKWLEKLRPFEEVGLVKLSDSMVVKDVKANGSLQVVPLDKKKEEIKEEAIEKQEIANAIGVQPDEIFGVIRIEDRDGGSKLFNHDMTNVQKPLIVRLRNNNFKVLKDAGNGNITEMIGFDATPVSKQVASLLKDTRSDLFTNLKAGEVRAGKTNPNQNEYNIFQIRRAGESIDDDSNNLLFVSTSGKTDMNIIESRDRGEVRFSETPQSTIYPKNIYLESSSGTTKKKEIVHDEQNIDSRDIARRAVLLKKLLRVDDKIKKIDDTERLSELYSERTELLNELGMNEKDLIRAREEQEMDDWGPGFKRSRV